MRKADIGAVFERWNDGPLHSYLIEISGKVAKAIDPETDTPLLDIIVDAAGQKGTGRWTAVDSQHLAAPVPAIEAASDACGWALPLPDIAKVWRASCIIRSSMLDDMATALMDHPNRNLMRAPAFADALKETHDALQKVVSIGALHGIAMPALSSSLAYFDAMRTARGTANMIQGQRDFFGRHGFDRLDGGADCHGSWAE